MKESSKAPELELQKKIGPSIKLDKNDTDIGPCLLIQVVVSV